MCVYIYIYVHIYIYICIYYIYISLFVYLSLSFNLWLCILYIYIYHVNSWRRDFLVERQIFKSSFDLAAVFNDIILYLSNLQKISLLDVINKPYIYVIIPIYLSIFPSIFKVSSKETKLILFDSGFMLTSCN